MNVFAFLVLMHPFHIMAPRLLCLSQAKKGNMEREDG